MTVADPGTAVPPGRHGRDNAALLARLRRIEGQVRGLERMIEEDRYCVDVLVQIAAARSALQAVARSLLETHVQHCVAGALAEGEGAPAVAELLSVLRQFGP